MSGENLKNTWTRREVIQAGVAAAAASAAGSVLNAQTATGPASAPATQAAVLPMRPLGRTGAKVTVINQGSYALNPRILDHTYAQGVRYFDTADCYQNGKAEQAMGEWFTRTGKRKEIFLVTADHPGGGGKGDLEQLLQKIDKRLEALQTDHLDLFCIHGIGTGEYGSEALAWPRSKEFKEVAATLRKSGKTRFVGFTCHDVRAPAYMMAAAEGGFLDAVMVAYNPLATKPGDEMDRALEACHKAGVGLIAMKTMRGVKQVKTETLKDLTAHQAVIHATLSDERIASVCSEMRSFTHIDQNAAAARSFRKPLTAAQVERLRGEIVAAGMTFCAGCSACRGGIPGIRARAHDIVRYLSYYEQDGNRAQARALYRALPPEARDWSGADMAAARQACALHVNYAALLQRAAARLA